MFKIEEITKKKRAAIKAFFNVQDIYHYICEILIDSVTSLSKVQLKTVLDVDAKDCFIKDAFGMQWHQEGEPRVDCLNKFNDPKNQYNANLEEVLKSGALDGKENFYDLIFCTWCLHYQNNLSTVLQGLRRLLKSNGIIVGTFIGHKTLQELKAALMHQEDLLHGSFNLRFFPTIDIKSAAALLQGVGFTNVVTSSFTISLEHKSIHHLHKDIKDIGETMLLTNVPTSPISRKLALATNNHCLNNLQTFTSTVEVITFFAVSP